MPKENNWLDEMLSQGKVSASYRLHYHCDVDFCDNDIHTIQIFPDGDIWHLCLEHNKKYSEKYVERFLRRAND